MRRPTLMAFRVVLALCLGAATTVAIAWSLAAIWTEAHGPRHERFWLEVSGGSLLYITESRAPGHRLRYGGGSPTAYADKEDDTEAIQERWAAMLETARELGNTAPAWPLDWGPRFVGRGSGAAHAWGWPLVALWYGRTDLYVSPGQANQLHGGIEVPPAAPSSFGVTRSRALPLLPVWYGLLADTALFSLFWAGLLLAPGALRRRLRRAKGRCPVCGYDLKGQRKPGCPECGWNRTPAGSGDPAREP